MNINSPFNQDTIAYLLHKRSKTCSSDIAYCFPELNQYASWGAIFNEVQLISKGLLQLGIQKGDTVAILMTGRAELIHIMFATAFIGAIIVPLNTYSKEDEIRAYIKSSRPKAMFIGQEGHQLCYPAIMEKMISKDHITGSSIINFPIFVMDDPIRVPPTMRPYSDLIQLAATVDADTLLQAAQATTVHDPLILLYTSGTLGAPKGVLRTTASFLMFTDVEAKPKRPLRWMEHLTDRITKKCNLISLLPLYHMGGFGTIFTNLKVCNIRIVLLSHFHPVRALRTLQQESSCFLIGTPFMVKQMLHSAHGNLSALSSLIGISFTSEAVSSSLLRQIHMDLRILFFLVTYGSSEAGSVANGICLMRGRRHLLIGLLLKLLSRTKFLNGFVDFKHFLQHNYSLAGKVDPGIEMKFIQPDSSEVLPDGLPGEIVVRGHRVMQYWNSGAEHPAHMTDGWYRTGDIGFLDKHRNLVIMGRLHRVISRGGEKISPLEIEDVLLTCKEVRDAFVIGIPDELYGEQICACIVPQDDCVVTLQSVQATLASRLSKFKIPQYVVILPELPMSPTGKIALADIQDLAMEQIHRSLKHA